MQKHKKILVTRRWPEAVEHKLMNLNADVTLNLTDEPLSATGLVQALEQYDIICPTVTDILTADIFARCDRVRTRLLANFGVGINHIDLAAARANDVAVTNTPGVLTDATAEIALTLMLMSARRCGEGERHLRAGEWNGWRPTHMLSAQVTGKRLGIVGMGRIGTALARKAYHGLGMTILYTKRTPAPAPVVEELQAQHLPLDNLLAQADFVSLNCPATAETRHLINAAALSKMPQHAHLINTARGDVVDEKALAKALQKGDIAGAGLDVYADEPKVDTALLNLSQVVLLPHMGSGTVETREAMGMCALENVRRHLADEPLQDRVRYN